MALGAVFRSDPLEIVETKKRGKTLGPRAAVHGAHCQGTANRRLSAARCKLIQIPIDATVCR